jgi:hypothetical protein
MHDYSNYPEIFRPEPKALSSLLMVRVSEEMRELTRQDYQELLSDRIEWMIRQWLKQESQAQTQQRLATSLYHLNSSQEPPDLIAEPLWAWTLAWAETFIENNEVLMQKLAQAFPVTRRMENLDRLEHLVIAHDETNLADWLAELTDGMVTNDW